LNWLLWNCFCEQKIDERCILIPVNIEWIGIKNTLCLSPGPQVTYVSNFMVIRSAVTKLRKPYRTQGTATTNGLDEKVIDFSWTIVHRIIKIVTAFLFLVVFLNNILNHIQFLGWSNFFVRSEKNNKNNKYRHRILL